MAEIDLKQVLDELRAIRHEIGEMRETMATKKNFDVLHAEITTHLIAIEQRLDSRIIDRSHILARFNAKSAESDKRLAELDKEQAAHDKRLAELQRKSREDAELAKYGMPKKEWEEGWASLDRQWKEFQTLPKKIEELTERVKGLEIRLGVDLTLTAIKAQLRTWTPREATPFPVRLSEPVRERPLDKYFCSFCGKGQSDVASLIAGPGNFICNECVALCHEIEQKRLAKLKEGTSVELVP
jgi:hypothetical protein